MTGPQVTPKAAGVEYEIDIERIHVDPVQPRLHPDAELADSIRSQGILQAISVEKLEGDAVPDIECPDCGFPYPLLVAEGGHYMIVDGERRYRGAIAAGKKTILAKIVPPATEGQRLLRQLTSNTGKPLTAVEQAMAFKRIMETEAWSQAQLAKHLGRPKSVVGDRIRLIELDPVWLEAISSGKLQVSHAPILSTFSAVPTEYQAKAAKILFDDYRSKQYLAGDGSIPVDVLLRLLRVCFRDFIKETTRTPGYRGPTLEIKSEYGGGRVKYAADITLWRPCFRQWEKLDRKKSRQLYAGGHSSSDSYVTPFKKALKALKATGLELTERKVGSHRAEPKAGETEIFTDSGWAAGLHPRVLLENLDPSTLVHVKGQYGGDELRTSDAAAVEAAQRAYSELVAEISKKELAPLRAKLTAAVLNKYAVRGPGAPALLRAMGPERGAPKVVALAMGLAINGDVDDDGIADDEDAVLGDDSVSDAEKLLSALAAISALKLGVPDSWELTRKINNGLTDVAFKIDKAKIREANTAKRLQQDQEQIDAVVAGIKSKKRQKREARAAGKQVGDPARAKTRVVDAGPLDTDLTEVEEEELVEA